MLPFRMNPPSKRIEGTGHFLQRCEERLAGSSGRTKKKFHALYDILASGQARTVGLHGKYAIQFGGNPYDVGDYLVVAISAGSLDGFLSLLVNQSVIMQDTAIIPATRILPLGKGGLLSNPWAGYHAWAGVEMIPFKMNPSPLRRNWDFTQTDGGGGYYGGGGGGGYGGGYGGGGGGGGGYGYPRPTPEEIRDKADEMMERPARTRESAMYDVEGMAKGYHPELVAEFYPGWKAPDFVEMIRMVRALEAKQ